MKKRTVHWWEEGPFVCEHFDGAGFAGYMASSPVGCPVQFGAAADTEAAAAVEWWKEIGELAAMASAIQTMVGGRLNDERTWTPAEVIDLFTEAGILVELDDPVQENQQRPALDTRNSGHKESS